MNAFGITDRGVKREQNEDSVLINQELGLFAVADGMGGHLYGEVASNTATKVIGDTVLEGVLNADREFLSNESTLSVLVRDAMEKANAEVFRISRELPVSCTIGTTVSLALFVKKKVCIGHVGDSRIYRIRKGKYEKLSTDHNRAQELVDAGLLEESEAENHRTSHLLTRALGASASIIPDISIVDVMPGDSFLLSSDGLFRVMGMDGVMGVLMKPTSPEEKCQALLDMALEKGAPDNVTIIFVEPRKKNILQRILS
jgi:protein phosphatase